MSGSNDTPRTEVPAAIYLLADHLDAVLAAGEDLLGLAVDLDGKPKGDGVAEPWEGLGRLVVDARSLEISLISRGLQARNRTRDLVREPDRQDTLIRSLLSLYVSSTAQLAEAAQELADSTFADFDAGIDPLAYLRTRNVIAADAASLRKGGRLAIGEDFLVAGRIPLGPLLDVSARLLDLLDTSYGLFENASAPPNAETDRRPPPPAE